MAVSLIAFSPRAVLFFFLLPTSFQIERLSVWGCSGLLSHKTDEDETFGRLADGAFFPFGTLVSSLFFFNMLPEWRMSELSPCVLDLQRKGVFFFPLCFHQTA